MLHRLFHNTLLTINISVGFLLLLSTLASFISPVHAWLFVLFGLAYPLLLVCNIFFVIYWAVRRKKWIIISVVLILVSWKQLHSFYQLPVFNTKEKKMSHQLRLITYNVRAFNRFNWAKDKKAKEHILRFLAENDPDVICLQEYFEPKEGGLPDPSIQALFRHYPYRHVFYTAKSPKLNFGIVTLSRYPIASKGSIRFNQTRNISIYTDIIVSNDTVRIYNNHLQSIHLGNKDYTLIDTLSPVSYNDKEVSRFKNILSRFIDASKKRSVQADQVSTHIEHCTHPVIVCGDFNDTPSSYTYHRIRDGLKDAFIESGKGIGNTYFGLLPSFRIDYIFHSRCINSFNLNVYKLPYSDHFPLQCRFEWEK